MSADYRIEYVIQRRRDGEDDFSEIGFGSSAAWGSPEQCADMMLADIGHGQWETEPGQPDPADVVRECREVRYG